MTFTEAAVQVLRLVGKPLHYKEITDVAIEKDLLSHVGKSPEVTMGARLAAVVKKASPDSELVRVKPGVFALSDWDQATIDQGLQDRTPALKKLQRLEAEQARAKRAEARERGAAEAVAKQADSLPPDEEDDEEAPLSSERGAPDSDEAPDSGSERLSDGDEQGELFGAAASSEAAPDSDAEPEVDEDEDDEEEESAHASAETSLVSIPVPSMDSEDEDAGIGDDERARAELSAGANEIFEAEDDDDEPILGGDANDEDEDEDEGRGRRRRRGRGRRGRERERDDNDLPTYTVSDAPEAAPAVIEEERGGRERPKLDGQSGLALADALEQALGGYRRQGSASIKQLAEGGRAQGAAKGRGGRGGDSPQQQLISAAVRADALRRQALGQKPRFRLLSGGRLALTEWSADRDLAAIEREIAALVRRHQEAASKALAKRLSELPSRAFGEVALTLLEVLGFSDFRAVKRPGGNGPESHFSATWTLPTGPVVAAVVVRREGRDVGRERVTELRGSLHHYEQATVGVIVTPASVLSGAREEAAAPGATPVHLIAGSTLADLCQQHGLLVVSDTIKLSTPDAELFEALRAGG